MPMLSVQQKAKRRMTISRDMRRSRVVVAPGMRRRLLPGNRDISGSSLQTPAGTASGRPEAEADDERSGEVGFAHSSGEASERSGASRRGGGGAKGWNQGECGPANHGPDTEPESRVTCAGPHTRRRKQEPHRATDRALASLISPFLGNVYLLYVYDLWVRRWRQRQAAGQMIVIRYADDTIVGFEHSQDAERFLSDLSTRLAQFGLGLHPDKTRLIEFGRHAVASRQARGFGKPQTFDFLGFTHYCATRRSGGGFVLGRTPMRKRMRAKLREIKEHLRATRHDGVEAQGKWLAQVLRGRRAKCWWRNARN